MVGCMRLKVIFIQIIISSDPNRGQIQKKILWYNKMLKIYPTKGQYGNKNQMHYYICQGL